MAITLTSTFSLRKQDKYDLDWHLALNQNFDDIDSIMGIILKGQYMHLSHEESAGVDGGPISTTWTTRNINTVVTNRISGASLASNLITLPAGTYRIRAVVNAYNVEYHRARLYDATNSADLLISRVSRSRSGTLEQQPAEIVGEFTLSDITDLEIQHICEVENLTSGQGKAANLGGTEKYADVEIFKIDW